MKATRIIVVAFCLGLLSSCGLVNSLLKIPVGLLRAVGRTAGVSGLTDDAPQPVTEGEQKTTGTIEDAAQKRQAASE
ncbi:MAG: hypothetical protein H7A51_15560 [Akkermansiaceae bacterium]|nr:hypothetical protein [Akkermansiaceae bacterium]